MTKAMLRFTVYTKQANGWYLDQYGNVPTHTNDLGHGQIVDKFAEGNEKLAGQERCYEFKRISGNWFEEMEYVTRSLPLRTLMEPRPKNSPPTAVVLVTYWSDRATISILEQED